MPGRSPSPQHGSAKLLHSGGASMRNQRLHGRQWRRIEIALAALETGSLAHHFTDFTDLKSALPRPAARLPGGIKCSRQVIFGSR